MKRLYTIACLFVLTAFCANLNAQSITCNNHINVGVNFTCSIDLTIDMFIEGDINLSEDIQDPDYTFVIFDLASQPLIYGDYTGPTLINGIILDANLQFVLYYQGSPLCWGTVLFEDKIAPELDCDCPKGGEDPDGDGIFEYQPECTLTCYELPIIKERYWDRLRDELIPEDFEDFVDDNTGDNCDGITEDMISYYDVYKDLGCNEGTILTRTWTITYPSGYGGETSTKSCVREYFFRPIGLETLDTARLNPVTGLAEVVEDSLVLPFPVVTMDCGNSIAPHAIAAYFDNPATEDQDTDDDRLDPDELDIDKVIENNEGIPYAYPHYYVNGRNPSGPHAQPINTEVCNIIVGYTDQDIEACSDHCYGNNKVLRTWTILDWCSGEFINYGQVIKVIDDEGPDIFVEDISVSVDPWKCSADVELPHPDHLNDFCDNFITYSIGSVSGGLSVSGNADLGYILHDAQFGEVYRVEYVSQDCCGNIGRKYIDVTIVDYTPPVPVTKENITTSLTNIGNPIDGNQGISKIYATDVDNGSYDACGDVEVHVRRTGVVCPGADTLWGDFVRFCCEDLEGHVSREFDVQFRVTDEFGNVNYAWSKVLLEDKSNSTQTCPPDLILTCDMDYNDFTLTGLPGAFSACGELDLGCDLDEVIEDTEPRRKGPFDGHFNDPRYDGVEVPAYDPSCGYGAVRRQFRSCASCTQWFVIEPINPFNEATLSFPGNMVIDCDGFETGEPDFDPATCSLIGVSVESDTFHFENGACMKILNHWTVINWCGYDPTIPNSPGKWEYTQEIKIIDTQDPILTVADSLCINVDADCIGNNIELSARATDNGECASDWMKWEITVDMNSDWIPDYTYGSNLLPFVNNQPNPYYVYPTGNDELVTIKLPDGMHGSNVWHRVVWRVYDGCGNNTSTVKYFQITDKKAPTPYCLNLSTAVMSESGTVELWAIDFDAGSFDNCSPDENLLFTFTDVVPPPRDDSEYDSSSDLQWYNGTFWYYDSETGDYEDQDDYGDEVHRWDAVSGSAGKVFTADDMDINGNAHVPIYVWDENGNVDFCVVILRLIDNMGVGEGRIAGQIMTETGDMVEGVMAELMSDAPTYPAYNMTDQNGEYAFSNAPFSNDYRISGSKTDDYLNGVSTLDLLLIQRHVLGQSHLDSPYKRIAADINNDMQITAIDLIELRKLILGVYTELPNNDSWKCVDASQILDLENPWSYKNQIFINDLQDDMMNGDFVAVKIGDVNDSAISNANDQDENTLAVILSNDNNEYAQKGDLIKLDMRAGNENLFGYQFTLNIDQLKFTGVESELLTESNIAVFDNQITLSYSNIDGIEAGEYLGTLLFEVKNDLQTKNAFSLSSDITKTESYTGNNLAIKSIGFANDLDAYALYQNEPNPFNNNTIIGFDLPGDRAYSINFYDLTGRTLHVIKGQGQKGHNEVNIDIKDLSTTGMVLYTLQTEDYTATKHMIVIE